MKKFTFKKVRREGRFRCFETRETKIKLNKKEVGHMAEDRLGHWSISLAVKKKRTKENPASFKWVHLKKKSTNENEAREFIKKYNDNIQNLYNLHYFEN